MSVLLYARVSTGEQAERDLSIPAQLHALRRRATDERWPIAGEYQDVGSGKTLRGRTGLLSLLRHASSDRTVDVLLVHRVDRLARNIYGYLTLKGKLRRVGVRIVSLVEGFDDNPMGEFLEHIMAAHAEFYSANLGLEIRKGIDESLRRGRWARAVPVGYLKERGRVLIDPARSPMMREAFERFATGTVPTTTLSDELHRKGLVSRTGKRVTATGLCRLLKNPFYAGIMRVRGIEHDGTHPALVSREVFARVQEVFRQKDSGGRTRIRLEHLLSGKVRCPSCGKNLIPERHVKPSGRVYSYYRCHWAGSTCRYLTAAEPLETEVVRQVRDLRLAERAAPILRRQLREEMRRETARQAEQVRALRAGRRGLDVQYRQLVMRMANELVSIGAYEKEFTDIHQAMRACESRLRAVKVDGEETRGTQALLEIAENCEAWLASPDPVLRRRAVDGVVECIEIVGGSPEIIVRPAWRELRGQTVDAPAVAVPVDRT
ncbi:hypothetical protein EPO33_04910 [Patescibacteria group bacterium]|nr:MAG: hypothetical protein EPO33_04910 [Patescibacteria group bacterium]